MHYRTAQFEDWEKIKKLHLEVSKQKDGIARWEDEITDDYVQAFMKKSLENGLMIVGEHPDDPEQIVAEIHGSLPDIHVLRHVMTDVTIAVHPAFQGKKVGRTILTIFLEEIGRNWPKVGKVELITRESNTRAIHLYQSLGFLVEGRLEMRIKTPTGGYEADIPMGWQNPNFEFD